MFCSEYGKRRTQLGKWGKEIKHNKYLTYMRDQRPSQIPRFVNAALGTSSCLSLSSTPPPHPDWVASSRERQHFSRVLSHQPYATNPSQTMYFYIANNLLNVEVFLDALKETGQDPSRSHEGRKPSSIVLMFQQKARVPFLDYHCIYSVSLLRLNIQQILLT